MEKLLGLQNTTIEDVKKEYLKGTNSRMWDCVSVCVYADRKYGAVAIIKPLKEMMEDLFKGMGKIGKIDWEKPVNTSKWVKPDEESIRNTLVTNLFMLEILKKDTHRYSVCSGKVEVCYGLLHGHSPSNPQTFTHYGIMDNIETIVSELKPKSKLLKERYGCSFTGGQKRWKPRAIKNARKMYKAWKKDMLKNMIKTKKFKRGSR